MTIAEKSKNNILPAKDKRGSATPENKLSDEQLKDLHAHIMSYDPSISHYRRAHAPKRLYLPSSFTISSMHKNYIESGGKCSNDKYRKEVASKNISFAALGKEGCEDCLSFKEHQCEKMAIDGSSEDKECEACSSQENHLRAAAKTRAAYKADAAKTVTTDEVYFSVDLQKVIMLPRLPGVKTVAFTQRIIAYNETFAPLGDKNVVKNKGLPVAMTWHQAEGGRSAQEICSTYLKFLEAIRDIPHVVFWVDNCSSQNKCWFLFTCLCNAVNSQKYHALKSITLKYFERGHSFMSADSYHHLVEKAMKAKEKVYDFLEFVECLNVDGKAVIMNHDDFLDVPRGVSQQSKFTAGKPLLNNISIVKFQRGSTKLYWKKDYEENDYREAEFLQKKLAMQVNTGKLVHPALYLNGKKELSITFFLSFQSTDGSFGWIWK